VVFLIYQIPILVYNPQHMETIKKQITKAKILAETAKNKSVTTGKFLWLSHRKKTIIGIIVVVIILLIILGGSHTGTVNTPYTAVTQNVVDEVVLSGRTESISSVNLGFADSGRVDKVFVTEGQQVKKEQVLAELEMGDLRAQYTSARAGLVIAQANLNQGNTNLDKVTREQDAIVEAAKRNLYGNLEAYPDDIFADQAAPTIYGSYQGDVAGTYNLRIYPSAAETGASIEYTGLENGNTPLTVTSRVPLGTKGLFIQFPSSTAYTNAKWVVPVPNDRSSSYASLKNAYDTALAARDRAIEIARADVSGDSASVLQARVDQAQASMNQIASAMSRRRIIAPFSGTISSVDLKEGESTIGISKDTSPGVSMLATDQYKVVIKIPEIDVSRVMPNTPVDIILDAYGPDVIFKGTLTAINPAETIVDGVPVYEGTVVFAEKDERVRSGMTSTVKIVVGQKESVVTIPGNYIREDKVKRKFFVDIVDSNDDRKTNEREVKVGIRGSDGSTEITEGLASGDVVSLPAAK
jgi:RND family efflux transporter MFP subunit